MLALRMEAVGLHPFHASAVRYHDRTILFLGGESNHGKSMGQIEACRRGGAARLHRDDGDRRGGHRGRRVQVAVPQEADRGHRACRQGGARAGRGQVLRLDADVGDPRRAEQRRRRRRPRHRRQLRRVDRRDDPVRAAVPDLPFAPELLPAQRAARPGSRDADGRHRRPPRGQGRLRPARSPSGRISSSGRPPRRSCSTRWTGCSSPRPCDPSSTSVRPISTMPSPCSPGTVRTRPPAGGWDRPDHPVARRIDPARRRGRRQGHRRARRGDPR